MSKDVLELGMEIQKSLALKSGQDLLTDWMSQYLAEKLVLLEKGSGNAKRKLAKECSDLIVKLWTHRHSLPDHVKPLNSFEPMFRVLEQLSSERPRSIYFEGLPANRRAGDDASLLTTAALAIDRGSNEIIRFLMLTAVDQIPKRDKRWAKVRGVLKGKDMDLRIIIKLVDGAESLLSKDEELKSASIKELAEMIQRLRTLAEVAASIESNLEQRLDVLRESTKK